MAESLKEKTAQGLFWGALNSGATQVLNLVIGLFLARLLTDADYGIIGVLSVFTAIAGNLQSSGFEQGLVNLKNPTANDYNSVFWFNIIASITIYMVLFFSAPLIAHYFHEPRLVALSRFVFLCFVISASGINCAAYMQKNMMNRELAICGIVALSVSGVVGIVLAFCGYAFWSMAWQQFTFISVLTLGRYYFTPWQLSLRIDFGPVRRMFGFSVNLLITNIVNTLSQNVLTFIFGRFYTMAQVGNFTQANKWSNMASSTVSTTIGQIAQPMMVMLRDDRGRELNAVRKVFRFTAFLSFPAMLGLSMVAREFIIVSIGSKWESCVLLLRILCVSAAFLPFYTIYQNLVISHGKSNVYMWCNVGQLAGQLVLVAALYAYGITVMVTAYACFTIAWLAVWQTAACRIVRLRLPDVCRDVVPFMLSGALVMAVVYAATGRITNPALLLIVRIMAAALLYYLVMKLARVVILDECMAFVRRKLGKKETEIKV